MMDKLMHLTAGLFLGAIVGISTGSAVLALLTGLVAGISKEIYDNIAGGDVEALDVVATAAGGGMAAMLVEFVKYMGS